MGRATMSLIWLALTLSGLVSSCSTGLLRTLHSNDTTSLSKRWAGARNWEIDVPTIRRPWPVVADGTQPIRYCFSKESDYDSLNDLLLGGIKVWEPAMAVSNLLIVPDSGLAVAKPICGQNGVRKDALKIMDSTTLAEDDDMKGETGTIYGYTDQTDPEGGPNVLYFKEEGPEEDTARMAHELGHVLGLIHEHQRPDAADHLVFRCEYVQGYEKVIDMIRRKQPGIYKEGDTIERACTDQSTAARYNFEAAQLMPLPDLHAIGETGHSLKFDPDSIMNYRSYDQSVAARDTVRFPNKAVLVRGTRQALANFMFSNTAIYELLPGGCKLVGPRSAQKYDWTSPRVSEGDVAAVRFMYPKPGQGEAQEKEEWRPVFADINMAAGGQA